MGKFRSKRNSTKNDAPGKMNSEPDEPTWDVGAVAELRKKYGLSLKKWRKQQLNSANVPDELRPLIPLAEFWGITDDIVRAELLEKVSENDVLHLRQTLKPFIKILELWLCDKRRAATWYKTDEYAAFSCLTNAADGF